MWDPRLIPPETRQFPAFDYDASGRASKEKALTQASGRVESESRYMIDCMSASIGKVAVLHQCVCDILPLGAREPLAIQLAEQASVAVDQPKTGLEPLIPEEGAAVVRYDFYLLSFVCLACASHASLSLHFFFLHFFLFQSVPSCSFSSTIFAPISSFLLLHLTTSLLHFFSSHSPLLSSTPPHPQYSLSNFLYPYCVAYDLIREHGYPDYMENATKPSYPSKKPLGKLYHHLRSRACELTLSNTRSIGEEIEADKRYLSEGRFGYMERAMVTYESYCRDVTMIMVRFELKSGERAEHSIYIINVHN